MAEVPNIAGPGGFLLPLEQLFDELQQAGFARDRFGVRVRLRVQELLNRLEAPANPFKLKFQLAALICQSAEEQSKFYSVFDALAERIEKTKFEEKGADKEEDKKDGATDKGTPPPGSTAGHETPPPPSPRGQYKPEPIKAARKGPITVELNFRDDGYRPWSLSGMETVTRSLREKEPTGIEEWDIPASIQKTIRSGGAPDFVSRRRKKAPQYLMLIEQQSARDHLAGFYADLAMELSRRDLDIDYYFYDGVPQHCWKDRRNPASFTHIERLHAEFPKARLIIVGEPEGLLDRTPRPDKESERFVAKPLLYPSPFAFQLRDDWPSVALLNTRTTVLWGKAEETIHYLFPVAPATLKGLGSLMEQWTGRISYRPSYWKQQQPEAIPPQIPRYDMEPETILRTLYNLRGYLGPKGYTWLCAIAVYPEVYWPLTKMLHDEAISAIDVPDESLRQLLWHQTLLQLGRLEWLRKGAIPPEYRQELRKDMDKMPVNAADVRRQLLEVLSFSENTPPPDSYAEKDRAYTVALLDHERYVLLENPDDSRKMAMKEKLQEEIAAQGVAVSDIEDAIGRSLFKTLPELPAETARHFWVLWVDDVPDNNQEFQQTFAAGNNVRFVNATDTDKALAALNGQKFDLVISDVSRHGDRDAGRAMLERFTAMKLQTPVLFFTHPNYVSQYKEELIQSGALDVVTNFNQLQPILEEQIRLKAEREQDTIRRAEFMEGLRDKARAVCRVVLADGGLGTGFIVEGGVLMTCNHVIPNREAAATATVEFNYEKDEDGNPQTVVSYKLDPTAVFISSPVKELNFTVVRIVDREDAPLSRWGFFNWEASQAPEAGEELGLIHHPRGEYKQIETNIVLGVEGAHVYYGEDSLGSPGTSGAPLVDRNMYVIAMHQARLDNKMVLGKQRTARQGVLMRDVETFLERVEKEQKVDPRTREADAVFDQAKKIAEESPNEALELFAKARAEYELAGNQPRIASALHEAGKLQIKLRQLDAAAITLNEALKLYAALEYGSSQAFVLADLARAEHLMRRLDDADKHFREALDMLSGLSGNTVEESLEILLSLSDIALERNNDEDARRWIDMGNSYATESGNKRMEFIFLYQSGRLNNSRREYAASIEALQKAVEIAPSPGDRANALLIMAYAYIGDGDLNAASNTLIPAIDLFTAENNAISAAIAAKELVKIRSRTQTTPYAQSNAPATPSRFGTGKTRFLMIGAPTDLEYATGVERHIKRLPESEQADVINALQTEENVEQAYRDKERADYVLVFVSPNLLKESAWLGLAMDAIETGKKVLPIMVTLTDVSGTGLENMESLPKGSKNTTIRQFEDTEDAYLVIARNIRDIAGLKPAQDSPTSETPPAGTEFNRIAILNLVAEDRLKEALQSVADAFPGNLEIRALQARNLVLEDDILRGVLTYKETEFSRTRIKQDLVYLVGNLEETSVDTQEQKKEAPKTGISKQVIRQLIAKGQLKEALQSMAAALPGNSDIILLQGQYATLEKDIISGVISPGEANITRGRITNAVLQLVDTIEEANIDRQEDNPPKTEFHKLAIKQLIGEGRLKEALQSVARAFPNNHEVIVLQAQYAQLELDIIGGTLSQMDESSTKARISGSLLELVDTLEETLADNPAQKPNRGVLLYTIPEEIALQTEIKVVVRVAADDTTVVSNIIVDKNVNMQNIDIAELMSVVLTAESSNFEVRNLSPAEQFILKDDFTEWIFFLKPNVIENPQLTLRVSRIETINNIERKKEVVHDISIRVVPGSSEETQQFTQSGFSFETQNQPNQPIKKKKSSKKPPPDFA